MIVRDRNQEKSFPENAAGGVRRLDAAWRFAVDARLQSKAKAASPAPRFQKNDFLESYKKYFYPAKRT